MMKQFIMLFTVACVLAAVQGRDLQQAAPNCPPSCPSDNMTVAQVLAEEPQWSSMSAAMKVSVR
jgi:hypothetical protein